MDTTSIFFGLLVGKFRSWEIPDRALLNCDVRAWLKLPSTPSNMEGAAWLRKACHMLQDFSGRGQKD
jgi:hypothetical protein